MSKLQKKITIYDIAREAGVSPATVSRIIKGSSPVSLEKAERVKAVISKYDFRPSAIAQALSETRTKLIGMVMADALNPYYNTLFTSFDQEATRHGYVTLLLNARSQPTGEVAALDQISALRTDAVIIFGGRADLWQQDAALAELLNRMKKQMPVILGTSTFGDAFPSVSVDHDRSMVLALSHLLKLGHKDIGFLYAGEQFYGTHEKLHRFRAMMAEHGLPVREEWLIPIPRYDAPSGQMGVDRLMALKERPTALIGINDTVAAGMLQALNRYGVRVPQDMSIIGFDDIFLTNLTTPTLSAVGYDYEEMARTLFDVTMRAINGEEFPAGVLVPPVLSVKESCAPPRSPQA